MQASELSWASCGGCGSGAGGFNISGPHHHGEGGKV